MALRSIVLAESGIGAPRTTKIPTCNKLRRQIVEAERHIRISHYMIRTDVGGDPVKFRDQNRLVLDRAMSDYKRLSCSDLMLDMSRFGQRLTYVSSVIK